ncbi:MAG TPA: site-2 protease family protein, partial [Gemmataceae bacterium]|nr:site-2 protease family protein [Gemmataceae bacterium]
MWDPFSWSLPLGRLFGITVRVNILFPIVAIGLILRYGCDKDAPHDAWVDATMVVALLFASVLLHEFGHCFGARLVDGDATQVVLWPLGGLAAIEVPHTWRANFIATAAGPAVNLLICVATCLALLFLAHVPPPFNPFWDWMRVEVAAPGPIKLFHWDGSEEVVRNLGFIILARLFWVNWILFLFNMVLVGFPMDAGRLLQCVLWPRYGFRRSMLAAIFLGFVTAIILGVIAIVMKKTEILVLCLALFIYFTCRQQYLILEHGSEDSLFGYDFSQGYTSLEREQPPRRRRPNFLQRWLARRAAHKMQLEMEEREAEERRMDELLEKV